MSPATITERGLAALAYDEEQDAIATLTRGLSASTARLVRETIQRAVDHGRQLDTAWDEFRANSSLIERARVPDPGQWHPLDEQYHDLAATEQRITGRIDALRKMLGVRS